MNFASNAVYGYMIHYEFAYICVGVKTYRIGETGKIKSNHLTTHHSTLISNLKSKISVYHLKENRVLKILRGRIKKCLCALNLFQNFYPKDGHMLMLALSVTLESPMFENRFFVITSYYVIAASFNFSERNLVTC